MARREVIDCDRCAKKACDAQRVTVAVDRKMDGAGSMETHHEEVDLCFDCLARELQAIIKTIFTYEEAKEWVRRIQRVQKANY